jgi:hypothetical protein
LPKSNTIYDYRKSALENATQEVTLDNIKQPEFSFLDFLLSWIIDENQGTEEISKEETLEDITVETENPVTKRTPFSEIGEEEHLELFYIASCLFLTYMIGIILKRNWNYSRKKATFLTNIKKIKLQEELNTLSTTTPGFMRLNSYH